MRITHSDFALKNGSLTPIVGNQESTDSDVSPGGTLEFQTGTTAPGEIVTPAQIYCGIVSSKPISTNSPDSCHIAQSITDPAGRGTQPRLSIQGNSSDFSLCQSGDLNVVVFEATSDNFGSYDYDSCYGVAILIFEHL